MEIQQSLLINGVMITPAAICTAKVQKAFSDKSEQPFMVLCDMMPKPGYGGASQPVSVAIPCADEAEGQQIIKQLFDLKTEDFKLMLQRKSDRELLQELLDMVKARLPESNE